MVQPRCLFIAQIGASPLFFADSVVQAFGLVCSAGANSIYDGKLAYVPALEDVLVWDVKKGQQVLVLIQGETEDWSHRYHAACNVARSQA